MTQVLMVNGEYEDSLSYATKEEVEAFKRGYSEASDGQWPFEVYSRDDLATLNPDKDEDARAIEAIKRYCK